MKLFCFIQVMKRFLTDFNLWDCVDVLRDNHVLIFYTIIYYRYTEHTDELQLDDLQVAG
jgi:hypothetical protein